MLNSIKITADKIRKLEIQGARNVAIASINAIKTLSDETKTTNGEDFLKELLLGKKILYSSRETEPLMRNAIRWIIGIVKKNRKTKIEEIKKIVGSSTTLFLKDLENSYNKIAKIGAKRIKDDSIILTHCHSSTVTNLLKKAKNEGKKFEVICTETRPRYQGRVTAKELTELGLKTTFIVDSAARSLMNKVNLVLVGADAITSQGNVINKIGTSMIGLVSKEARTPFYVVSELLKFDPETIHGDYEKIEERDPSEVWLNPPDRLVIRNPAFEVVRRDFIHGIICEEGIISPHSILEVMHRRYPWVLKVD